MAINHGYDILGMERRQFLKMLLDSLPDKSHTRLNTKLEIIKEDEDGVEVTC